MNRYLPALAAACFSLASVMANAQTPPAGDGKGPGMMGRGEHHRMKPCKEEANPAKCEADRKAMRDNMKAARDACKDKPDRRACMTESMCAKSPDPAKCQAGAKERQSRMSKHMDERQKAHEACTGKRGEELGKCMREQREKSGHGRHDKKG
jgi:Spy/CpxP family protein refolding chaperone